MEDIFVYPLRILALVSPVEIRMTSCGRVTILEEPSESLGMAPVSMVVRKGIILSAFALLSAIFKYDFFRISNKNGSAS